MSLAIWHRPQRYAALLLAAILTAVPVAATADEVVYAFSPRHHDLQLHWQDGGARFETLASVRQHLEDQGRCVDFLSNAGIFGQNDAPLGLHIENGKRLRGINPAKGSGNFSWNSGIFALRRGKPEVRRHTAWPGDGGVSVANQSGPTLVIGGRRTSAGRSDAGRYSRSAIVAYRNGRVGFVQTQDPIAFRDLVDMAKTEGRVQGMLYLDGNINDWWQRGGRQSARLFQSFAGIFSVSRPGPCPDPLQAPLPVPKPAA